LCGDTPISSVNTSRLRSIFAYLVLNCDTPVSRERFAFLLWPDSNEPQARTNLRQLLHHLRRALPPECRLLACDHQNVQWLRDASCSADIWEFDAAVERGALEEAANLYRDDLLSGFYDDWIVPLRAATANARQPCSINSR
jgi:DNA-binding SARP family transcriptional activator